LCATAAVVISAVIGLICISDFLKAWSSGVGEFVVMLITFFCTILIETSIGIASGIIAHIIFVSCGYSSESPNNEIEKQLQLRMKAQQNTQLNPDQRLLLAADDDV
jgi:MFS superfamily sulfate permease-like transporter